MKPVQSLMRLSSNVRSSHYAENSFLYCLNLKLLHSLSSFGRKPGKPGRILQSFISHPVPTHGSVLIPSSRWRHWAEAEPCWAGGMCFLPDLIPRGSFVCVFSAAPRGACCLPVSPCLFGALLGVLFSGERTCRPAAALCSPVSGSWDFIPTTCRTRSGTTWSTGSPMWWRRSAGASTRST